MARIITCYYQEFIEDKPKNKIREIEYKPSNIFRPGTKLLYLPTKGVDTSLYQVKVIDWIDTDNNFVRFKVAKINSPFSRYTVFFPDDFTNYTWAKHHLNDPERFYGCWKFYCDPFSDWFKKIWLQ